MKTIFALILTITFTFQFASATSWFVGATQKYAKPSQVSQLVKDGDTVNIDSGEYLGDVAYWTANKLLLRGKGGLAKLRANGSSYGNKAIWVIGGENTTVEWIEFSECTVVDKNGAGIRFEAKNLTVRNCYFHNNDDGILGGAIAGSKVKIEFCEFAENGFGDGQSHNLYIGHIDTLLFQYNYSHNAKIGHELKSRAEVNYILYNRLSDETTGTASRNIDLPNGGVSIILGNIIEQGPISDNSNLIGYGLEGLTNKSASELYIVNNTFVNNKTNGNFIQIQNNTELLQVTNNIFAGSGSLLSGQAKFLDSSNNINNTSINTFNFKDATNYDFSILENSIAKDAGIKPGRTSDGFSLTPIFTYKHPANFTTRTTYNSKFDIGAFEYFIANGIETEEKTNNDFTLFQYDNGIIINSKLEVAKYKLYDLKGNTTQEGTLQLGTNQLSLNNFAKGIYFVTITNIDNSTTTLKFLK